MRNDDEVRVQRAIRAVQSDEPEVATLNTAAERVAERLGIEFSKQSAVEMIHSCADVQSLLPAYRAGQVPERRGMLIAAHLRECSTCRSYQAGRRLDWTAPVAARKAAMWRPRAYGWGLAACIGLLVTSVFVYRIYWQVPQGVRAEVQSIDGSAYDIANGSDRRLSAGDSLQEGDLLRTSGGSRAVIRLADGSRVEIGERSALGIGARGRNMTVALDHGAVIVEAAHRTSGHLYVKTPDCRVAVTGTVFSVNAGMKGSRVAVVQGTVNVAHAGTETVMHAGEQVATSDNLDAVPVAEQIAWSPDRDKYLVLMGQFAVLQRRIEQIPFPEPRYASDLLKRVPSETLLYVSVPNLGEFLSEANSIFQDQLQKSPALRQWWSGGKGRNAAELDGVIGKIHQISQYLGDEVVVVGLNRAGGPEHAILADVKQGGLAEVLKTEFAEIDGGKGVVVLDQKELATLPAGSQGVEYALVRDHELVMSNSVATLKEINSQLNAGASGFETSDFGKQISGAYGRGAGVILAADLKQIVRHGFAVATHHGNEASELNQTGIEDMQYLIAEHREKSGEPENHLSLQFAGARKGVASWLGAPAAIGSLDFVSQNASLAVAMLSKDPKAIVDDMLAMAATRDRGAQQELSDAESKLQINLREDLAANFGGDALMSLDGPILPTPSWKMVVEVYDSERLEKTLERLLQAVQTQHQGKDAHQVTIEWKDVGSQRYYLVHDLTSGKELAHYTFSDGYMIVAPTRALLMDALHTHTTGTSLARSAAFKALLPKDENENYSAIAYQNLSPVLTPLLSQVSGGAAVALRELAADSKPTAVCAWGEANTIEAASNSRLFGFDFLTLGALIGNHHE